MDSNLCYKELAVLKRGELEYNINLMMKGDNEARNKIINHYVKVIKNMIDHNYLYDKEDLLSHGIIGMLNAIDTYHDDLNSHLTTLVIVYATKEIDRYLKIIENDNLVKSLWDSDETNLFDEYELKEKNENLKSAIDKLPYIDRMTIKFYFGIGCKKVYNQNEIADIFKLSKTRINKILERALIRLRNILVLEPIKKRTKSNVVVPFHRIFEGYTNNQVNKALMSLNQERLEIIKYLYYVDYDIAIKRWNELSEKTKIEFYQLVDEIRIILRNLDEVKILNK